MYANHDRANHDRAAGADDQSGIGLIEIVVSMFLIALLAMAFLPLLITSLKSTRVNSSSAAATQLVSQQLAQLRILPATCASTEQFRDAIVDPVTDARGVVLTTQRIVDDCPASLPGTVRVRVVVTDSDGTSSEATTLFMVVTAA